MFGNNHSKDENDGGLTDSSLSRISLPRTYDREDLNLPEEQIHMCVGDRVFIKDVETLVVNHQQVEYNPNGSDYLQFPAKCVEILMDSQGNEFKQGVHFTINNDGNIVWGNINPGIDIDTGKGRVYSVRYKYQAHWYVIDILNEIRVANVTEDEVRGPVRMPYQVRIQREYMYHNRIKAPESSNTPKINELADKVDKGSSSREMESPVEKRPTAMPKVKVNISNIE